MTRPQRIAVLTSGGDAPGMNAAVRAVVRAGIAGGHEMLGVKHGYSGLINGNLTVLSARDVGGIVHLGGTLLGTSRCESMKAPEGQESALRHLRDQEISALVVIGGNGSQAGALALASAGMRVIGIASTIDNDLYGADVSLGTTTALDIALESIDRLRVTAAAHERAFLVEVMGRHCGYLAAAAAIAGGAEAVVVPEVATEPQEIESQLHAARLRGKSHAIVVVAEGAYHNADVLLGYFQEHSQRIGYEMRASRLGHIQRGGAPGAFDRMLGSRLGVAAIEKLEAGAQGLLLGWCDGTVKSTALAEAAGRCRPLDLKMLELARTLAL